MTNEQYKDLLGLAQAIIFKKYKDKSHIDPSDVVMEAFVLMESKQSDTDFIQLVKRKIKDLIYFHRLGRVMIIDGTKTSLCTKCDARKSDTEFYHFFNKYTKEEKDIPKWCKQCTKEYLKAYHKTPKGKAQNKKNFARYFAKNKDKWNSYVKERSLKDKENLTDSYVKRAIRSSGVKNEDITKDMVEAKRQWFIDKRNKFAK